MAPKRPAVAATTKKTSGNGSAATKAGGTNRPAATKAGGNKSGGAKAGAQQQRGRQAAWQARRRRNRFLAYGSVAVVVVVIAVLIVVKATGSGSGGSPRQPAPLAVINKLTSIPVSTLVEATADKSLSLSAPTSGGSAGVGSGGLTSGGHPELLFIGAEFCPICATQRWPLLIALSHFGTFSNVSQTHSAVNDGNIPTLSFYKSTYKSSYLTFTPVETTTNQPSGHYYKTLQTPTTAQAAIWKANSPSGESFPFIDFAGKWLLQTSQPSATLLEGHSFTDIANSIGSNENTIGVNIDASAAVLIKTICSVTGQLPAAACKAVANVSMGSKSTGTSTPAG